MRVLVDLCNLELVEGGHKQPSLAGLQAGYDVSGGRDVLQLLKRGRILCYHLQPAETSISRAATNTCSMPCMQPVKNGQALQGLWSRLKRACLRPPSGSGPLLACRQPLDSVSCKQAALLQYGPDLGAP